MRTQSPLPNRLARRLATWRYTGVRAGPVTGTAFRPRVRATLNDSANGWSDDINVEAWSSKPASR